MYSRVTWSVSPVTRYLCLLHTYMFLYL